jgi:hypothetical protein
MEGSGSTLIDHPGAGRVARILGGNQLPHEEVAALLLPMVRRAVRTERGPPALVSWLRRRSGPPHASYPTEGVALLAEDLARLLSAAAGSPADTLENSH